MHKFRNAMKKLSSILIIYGAIIIVVMGVIRPPYEQGHHIDSPISMNDVYSAEVSKDGYIYVLGSFSVQKFDMQGNFCGGGYFGTKTGKKVENNQLLSLSDERIVCYDGRNITEFNSQFDVLSIKSASKNYGKKAFFTDYPNNNSDENKTVKLGLFNNVKVNETNVNLKAFRNMLFSTPVGVFTLILGVFLKVYTERQKGKGTEMLS